MIVGTEGAPFTGLCCVERNLTWFPPRTAAPLEAPINRSVDIPVEHSLSAHQALHVRKARLQESCDSGRRQSLALGPRALGQSYRVPTQALPLSAPVLAGREDRLGHPSLRCWGVSGRVSGQEGLGLDGGGVWMWEVRTPYGGSLGDGKAGPGGWPAPNIRLQGRGWGRGLLGLAWPQKTLPGRLSFRRINSASHPDTHTLTRPSGPPSRPSSPFRHPSIVPRSHPFFRPSIHSASIYPAFLPSIHPNTHLPTSPSVSPPPPPPCSVASVLLDPDTGHPWSPRSPRTGGHRP